MSLLNGAKPPLPALARLRSDSLTSSFPLLTVVRKASLPWMDIGMLVFVGGGLKITLGSGR